MGRWYLYRHGAVLGPLYQPFAPPTSNLDLNRFSQQERPFNIMSWLIDSITEGVSFVVEQAQETVGSRVPLAPIVQRAVKLIGIR
jgi:hypothetical protein